MGGGTGALANSFKVRGFAVCPGSQQASECQAEQGKDDSQEANPLKLFGRQSLNFPHYLPLHTADDLNASAYF